MPKTIGRALAVLLVAGLAVPVAATEASAASARQIYKKGHSASAHSRTYRRYGNPAAGRAVAGAALGLIGAAAAGALASRDYDDYDDGGYGGYGYPYGGPGYTYGGYPPAPFTYGGYGYGLQVY